VNNIGIIHGVRYLVSQPDILFFKVFSDSVGNESKENVMKGTISTHGRDEEYMINFSP
jgi:hypothetical protein